jgi:hypothetical protein
MAQEEIIFKVGVDTGDSVQDVNKVGDAIENVGKDAKKTDGSFVNLRKELKQLTVQLQNLDPASKEFETVAKRAGQIKEQIRGVADAINDADPEKFGGKFQRTAEGIAGAFSAVTGAQALFGQQSEEIEKQMLKVQGAIALTQGISAMKELRNDATDLAGSIKNKLVTAFQSLNATQISNAKDLGTMTTLQKAYNVVVGSSTGVLKNLRIALAATGIGALILAVGYLIANFDKLKGSMSQSLTNAKNFEQSTTRQAEAARYASDNFAEYERTLKRLGYTEEEISNKRKARFKDAIDKTEKEIGASRKVYDEQLKNLKIVEVFDKIGFNATGRLLFGDENDAKAQQQKLKDLNATLTKLKNDQFDYNNQIKADNKQANEDAKQKQKEANQEAARNAKERRERLKQLKQEEDAERLTLQRKFEDLTVANIDDANARDIMALKFKHDREKEDLKKQYADKKGLKEEFDKMMLELDANHILEKEKLADEQKKAQDEKELADKNKKFEDQKASLEAEIITNAENFALKQEKQLELENADYEQKKLNALGNKAQLELIEAQHTANINAINKESTDYQIMLDETLKQSKENLKNAIGSIFGELAGLAKQGSNIQKAFAITQVAIDTATAISGLTAISFSPTNPANKINPLAPYIQLATGTAKIISSMARVKSILGSGVSVAPPTTGGGPNANLGIGANQQGTQQTVQAQSTYKVVVVDSDITKMQDKTKKVNAISTI